MVLDRKLAMKIERTTPKSLIPKNDGERLPSHIRELPLGYGNGENADGLPSEVSDRLICRDIPVVHHERLPYPPFPITEDLFTHVFGNGGPHGPGSILFTKLVAIRISLRKRDTLLPRFFPRYCSFR